jgi:serine protease
VIRLRQPLLCTLALLFGVAGAYGPYAQAPSTPSQPSKTEPVTIPNELPESALASGVAEVINPHRALALLTAIEQGLDHIPGEVLVKFKGGTRTEAVASVLSLAAPPTGARQLRWIGNLAVVPIDDTEPVPSIANRLALEPEVEYAQPNYFTSLHAAPNDPGLSKQWNLTAIEAPAAWDINPGGRDVLVAVIDSGVTTTTTNVTFRLWVGGRFALVSIPFQVNPDLDPSRFAGAIDTTPTRLTYRGFEAQPVFDTSGHGTHVSGTVGQTTNNNFGFAGVAYGGRLLVAKSCLSYWDLQLAVSAAGDPGFVPTSFRGGCPTDSVVAGIEWAVNNGARVINLSLGGSQPNPAWRNAIQDAVGRGVFVAIAAGNEYEEGNPVNYPAAYGPEIPGAMTVGAVGKSLRRAYYSSTGSHVEIAAPGGDDEDGGNDGLIHQWGLFGGAFASSLVVPRFDVYWDHPNMGTSMAAPHVTAVAGLLFTQGISDPAAIEEAIKKFARQIDGRSDEVGAGLVDARRALRGLGLAR